MSNVHVSRHPLVAHKLSILRHVDTPARDIRALVREISQLLFYEATADLPLVSSGTRIGPLASFEAYRLADQIAIVPIMRSGLAMLDAGLDAIPSARVLHLGLYREEVTCQPVEYYNKLSATPNASCCIIVDPMLATSGTARAAVQILKDWGVHHLRFVCICASRDGLEKFAKEFPDVNVYVGAVDPELNANGYILPGFGDAGDRLYRAENH